MQNLGRVLGQFRQAGGDDWSLRQILLFVRISESGKDGITLTELAEELDLSQQVVDRQCKALALRGKINKETGKKSTTGFGVIEYRKDIWEPLRWNVRLSDKGEKLWRNING